MVPVDLYHIQSFTLAYPPDGTVHDSNVCLTPSFWLSEGMLNGSSLSFTGTMSGA